MYSSSGTSSTAFAARSKVKHKWNRRSHAAESEVMNLRASFQSRHLDKAKPSPQTHTQNSPNIEVETDRTQPKRSNT